METASEPPSVELPSHARPPPERGHALGEGDLVELHCFQHWLRDHDHPGIDIFRFDANGKIVKDRDVLQIILEHGANDNTMF